MTPSQLYLLGYNVVQVVGWSVLLMKTALGLLKGLSNVELYNSIYFELNVFQSLAVLEVVNVALGFVRSPVVTTAQQVASRLGLVWLVLHIVELSRSSYGVPLVLICWSVTEVVRYSFYALTLVNRVPELLRWIRYSFFIVLYPLGVTGEMMLMFASLPEIAAKKHLTIEMPNIFNIGFSFWWLAIIVLIYYPIGFVPLYLYMFKQRQKVLFVEASKKRE